MDVILDTYQRTNILQRALVPPKSRIIHEITAQRESGSMAALICEREITGPRKSFRNVKTDNGSTVTWPYEKELDG